MDTEIVPSGALTATKKGNRFLSYLAAPDALRAITIWAPPWATAEAMAEISESTRLLVLAYLASGYRAPATLALCIRQANRLLARLDREILNKNGGLEAALAIAGVTLGSLARRLHSMVSGSDDRISLDAIKLILQVLGDVDSDKVRNLTQIVISVASPQGTPDALNAPPGGQRRTSKPLLIEADIIETNRLQPGA